ncbi:M20/M25/M40 family metallo-hydrolase [Arsukibacterium indicum]|uniref:Carboxypeptidase Q n=1 Tax=Arsukibacterium indicum TaxID=2848612 RepID=A0ABS6MKU2_9GAMM|nr:M20/M25/M40 family metallo-hydrolase [Arsukibacterium indicum]MBV2129436.1 M20/M25/M40 family metallo-hydrolase [Arsukibacterium indicum]
MKLWLTTMIAATTIAIGQPAQASKPELNNDLAYKLVESLTVEVGPRLAGSEADARAVAWAEQKFRQLGFDKVWTEPFTMQYWERGNASLRVEAPFNQALVLTALGGSVGTPFDGITSQVVMFDNLQQLQQANPAEVKDKIVFINQTLRKDIRGSFYGQVVGARAQGAVEAAKLGAKAIIIRSVGTSNNRFAHTGIMRYSEDVPRIPAAAISVPDAMQLSKMLAIHPETNLSLHMKNNLPGEVTSHNVIAEITGSKRPDEIVLIGAHIDSWDEGTGALDDGAGVGLVMATAALLKQQKPERTIRVVLFGNEEGGLIGARAYAAHHAAELKNHVFASESDFGAGRIWRFDTGFGEQALAFAAELQQDLKHLGIEAGSNTASGGPDVSVLKAQGVPVASLQQDGTDYFDFHHTPNDTLDKIDPAALQQNLKAWLIMTSKIANSNVDLRK